PSTLQLLHELEWLDDFLKLPHDELATLDANIGGEVIHMADFSTLKTYCKFIVFMPQWDFLDFLAGKGKAYPTFHLSMETEGVDLLRENGRVTGVRAKRKDGSTYDIAADLVVGTDGRHSTVRARAGLEVENQGAPMDVVWMRIPKEAGDPPQRLGNLNNGRILIMIDRTTYWQCAYLIAKGSFEELQAAGIQAFREDVAAAVPMLRGRVESIEDWSHVSLLEVRVDRLKKWHAPGVLCIGDAAHAMSPIGGIGINLAIQDAVAAANLLCGPLKSAQGVSDGDLAAVQARRMFPTVVTQAFQVFVQNHGVEPVLRGENVARPPLVFRLFDGVKGLRRLPARLIGVGVRPEHIRTPDVYATS
ncbi:MAG: FAD-dependent oxidoreductase, partial [Candidatus Eremiobacteraeota bacterium]|nr:FAD-dependent oxidoreductase [Candidatus Eremiobacteraeota bacterium]